MVNVSSMLGECKKGPNLVQTYGHYIFNHVWGTFITQSNGITQLYKRVLEKITNVCLNNSENKNDMLRKENYK